MFFVYLPHVQLYPNFCNATITSKTLTAKTSSALERPMHLFYRSLYLSPYEIAFREKEEQQERERLATTKSIPKIRGDPSSRLTTLTDTNPLTTIENDVMKGHFLQVLGQGHEPLNSSSSYCINLITPSDSPGVLHDFKLYLNALPSARPIYAFHGPTIVPPSVIDVYLERHPIDTKYYQQWTLPKDKTIWMMQNTEFFDRHELSNPDVGVMIVKNRIGLQKVLEYRHRHQMEYTVFYTKHTSQDVFNPSIERDWSSFLHLAGWSPFKNTRVIVRAWKQHPEWPTLTLRVMKQDLCDWIERECGGTEWNVPNIDYKCGNEPLEIKNQLQNKIGIHLCPSETEGFGHYINEARSAGVLIVTTNVAPMNELVDEKSGVLIGQAHEWWWQTKGDLFMPLAHVTIEEIEQAVERILLMSVEERKRMGRRARAKYLEDRTFFLNAMAALEASLCQDEIQINPLLPYLY